MEPTTIIEAPGAQEQKEIIAEALRLIQDGQTVRIQHHIFPEMSGDRKVISSRRHELYMESSPGDKTYIGWNQAGGIIRNACGNYTLLTEKGQRILTLELFPAQNEPVATKE